MLGLKNKFPNYPFEEFDPEQHAGPYYIVACRGDFWKEEYGDKYSMTRVGAELAHWRLRAKGVVLHALNGDVKVGGSHQKSATLNTEHVFYFSDKKTADDFKAKLPEMHKARGPLFKQVDDLADKLAADSAKTVHVIKTMVNETISPAMLGIWLWHRDSCKGEVWRYSNSLLVFEEESDLTLFKLKFGGAKKKA